MEITDSLAFVLGSWRLERSLADDRTGTRGTFTGSAVFTVTGPRQVRYQEEGDLRFGAHAGPARRSLTWHARGDGRVDVRFGDGRAFHVLDLRPGRWQAEHLCGGDTYRIAYHVLAQGVLEERWDVHGPRKSYHAVTVLARTGQSAQ